MPYWASGSVKAMAPFGAERLAYLFGLRAFHREKEEDLVRQRQLEKCLGRMIDHARNLRAIFWNNWASS